jgi:hypothetical protein
MKFLHSRKELDLVKEDEMIVNSSYVYLSELHLPNKQSVLDYLDKKGQKPAREAHVILFRGDKQIPDIEEIIVGPLPNPKANTIQLWSFYGCHSEIELPEHVFNMAVFDIISLPIWRNLNWISQRWVNRRSATLIH